MSLDKKIRALNHKRIDFFRKIKIKLSVALFTPFARKCESAKQNPILVLRLDGKLGDSVCATGFLREIKKQNQSSKLVVVCSSVSYQIYSRLSFIDQCIIVDRSLSSFFKCFFGLKKNNFNYIINTSHILNPKTLFLVAFIRANKKIGFENSNVKLFTDVVKINFSKEHITDRLAAVLRIMGSESGELSYEIKTDGQEAQKVQDYLNKINAGHKPLVVINSFAGARLRNLSEQKTKKLVELILKNWDAVVVSIANEGDHKILKNWIDDSYKNRWFHNPDLGSIDANMALVKSADLIITPDTAWVHIASALNKKAVCIFRKDHAHDNEKNSVIWAPLGFLSKTVYSRPELNAQYDVNDINSFDEQQVVDAARSLMESK